LPIPQKLYNVIKRLKTKEEVEQYFPGFLAFTYCTEQPIPRPAKNREEKKTILLWKEKETHAQSRICIQLTKKDC
jgi:hypothetical protein